MASRARTARSSHGLWKCYSKECRKQFTVRVGTVFEAVATFRSTRCCRRSICSVHPRRALRPPTPPSLGGRLQVGVVSGTPNSRSDAGRHSRRPWAAAAKLSRRTKPTLARRRATRRRRARATKNIVLSPGGARRFGAQLHVEAIGDLLVTVTYCLNQAMLRDSRGYRRGRPPRVRAIISMARGRILGRHRFHFAHLGYRLARRSGRRPRPARFRRFVDASQASLDALERIEKPVIGALHGFVGGLGLELALACDARIASVGTRLGMPEVRIGWCPTSAAPRGSPARSAMRDRRN